MKGSTGTLSAASPRVLQESQELDAISRSLDQRPDVKTRGNFMMILSIFETESVSRIQSSRAKLAISTLTYLLTCLTPEITRTIPEMVEVALHSTVKRA